jgi:oxygen-independent coproporphyrinogen-3 oxidase
MLQRDELPLGRALPVDRHHRLIREMILQLKTGRLEAAYFQEKFNTNIRELFDEGFAQLEQEGYLVSTAEGFELTRSGLLQVDRLLPIFFDPEHRGTRYT